MVFKRFNAESMTQNGTVYIFHVDVFLLRVHMLYSIVSVMPKKARANQAFVWYDIDKDLILKAYIL